MQDQPGPLTKRKCKGKKGQRKETLVNISQYLCNHIQMPEDGKFFENEFEYEFEKNS